MRPWALDYLACPTCGGPLALRDAVSRGEETVSGRLECPCGAVYPVRDSIPRFVSLEGAQSARSVASFGFQWDALNFDAFRQNWLEHVVARNFGGADYFRGKTVLDCGAGSGMHSRWMLECGAERVVSLELSESVDGIVRDNLKPFGDRALVVQCDIARPPIRPGSVDLVYCINVIQHTEDPTATTRTLHALLGGKGEMAVTYYLRDDHPRPAWHVREFLRTRVFRRLPKRALLALCHGLAALSMVPLLGWLLQKTVVVRGDVPKGPRYWRRTYRQTLLNTYDWNGSHEFQHYFTRARLQALIEDSGIGMEKVSNFDDLMAKRLPGQALRFIP